MLFSTDCQNLKMGEIQRVTFGELLKHVITQCGQILVSRKLACVFCVVCCAHVEIHRVVRHKDVLSGICERIRRCICIFYVQVYVYIFRDLESGLSKTNSVWT